MKIIALSDLHGYLPTNIPKCNVVCICGDIVPLEYQRNFVQSVSWFCLEFVPWADSLPCEKVIFIGGNHDFFLERITYDYHINDAKIILQQFLPGNNYSKHRKLVYLFDNSYSFNHVTFYGTPWVKDLSRWAFYKPDNLLLQIYDNIPKKVDVLLTHMPPCIADVGTVLQPKIFNTNTNYGSIELYDAILNRDIKYSLCGHVHSGNHIPTTINNTTFVNVSIKDENYKVYYEPFEFEI